jgi:hypothetical protein
MRSAFGLAVAVLVSSSALTRADDQADAKAILDAAIKAHGGAENLAKVKTFTAKTKGKIFMPAGAIDFTSEQAMQFPDRLRIVIKSDFMGQSLARIQVVKGEQGWISAVGETREMSKEQVEEAKACLYANWVTLLYPLTGADVKLAPLPGTKIDGKSAVGLHVASKDCGDMNLYFDKETGLLVKRDRTVKNPIAGGVDVDEEVLFSDYMEVDGLKYPTKTTIRHDKEKYLELETTEYKPRAQVKESAFTKP